MCKNIEFGYFVNPAATGASEINLQNQKKKKTTNHQPRVKPKNNYDNFWCSINKKNNNIRLKFIAFITHTHT